MSNKVEITVYLVGTDEDDAQGGWPFDSYRSAREFQLDNPGTKIWSVGATIDFDTMELEED